jgi:alpha-glucosidase
VAEAERLCVERQAADPRSMLRFVRRLAALRRRTPALQTGTQRCVEAGADVLAWLREGESDRLLAAVNFATEPAPLRLGLDLDLAPKATLVVSTDPDRSEDSVDQDRFTLGPSEGVLLRL